MGLCKCPKRKVTNQFCFEHRVNVCESCMVTNHPKCVVQSYCQWLKDSDYSSFCGLCSTELSQEDCLRLVCYHVFHLKCLDAYCRQYPLNTAPAGYVCPSCTNPIFPASNLVSPVADVLRTVLANKSWAREGLGLPLMPFDDPSNPNPPETHQIKVIPMKKDGLNFSVVNVETEASSAFHRSEQDRDEGINKYKRRPPLESFKRMLTRTLSGLRKISNLHKEHITYILYKLAIDLTFTTLVEVVNETREAMTTGIERFGQYFCTQYCSIGCLVLLPAWTFELLSY
nr:EOG090X0ASS [Macrothrix elegans]